jgi:hypothetical protein
VLRVGVASFVVVVEVYDEALGPVVAHLRPEGVATLVARIQHAEKRSLAASDRHGRKDAFCRCGYAVLHASFLERR